MSELEFNTDNTQIGFRLQYMELLNWGTFHNKIWKIEPDGNNSLLTGSIGSGKSTIVDALTCLIVPHHKIVFNKAAGAESKERNLVSYIKGNFSSKSDDLESGGKAVSLRYKGVSDATFTVVLANFTNIGYGANVSLAQVFWIENNKPQKVLIISSQPLTIKDYFINIEDARELRKRLKAYSYIELFDDNFSQYSQRFRHLFGMNSDKAIDLFYQTVSMKSVSSLTSFVKEQMLERTEIKAQIEDLKKRFDDLNKAYAAVQEARQQRDILSPLVELSNNFSRFEKNIEVIDSILQSVPCFFAFKKIKLLETDNEDSERKLLRIADQLRSIEETLNTKRDAQNQLKQDIRNNGGARLEQIAIEIQQKGKLRDAKSEKHKIYTNLTSLCQLETASTDKTFFRNLKNSESKLISIEERQKQILGEHGKLAGLKTNVEEKIKSETDELESLKKRENQIPLEFLNIREKLAGALEIEPEEIPFTGELLKVHKNEKEWEGALERLLRGFGVSMLVPEKYYNLISGYINARKLTDSRNRGMRFEYFKVPHNFKVAKFHYDIDADSVVNKIDIKINTPFEEWLETELQKRFNLRCVSIEEFQRQSDVITKEGQFKTGSQRHTKDDRRDLWDRKNFVLGWTNKEKIIAIEKHLNELKIEQDKIKAALKTLELENNDNNIFQSRLNQIISYKSWEELNWQDEVKAIAELEKESAELENSNDLLQTLQLQLDTVKNEIAEQENIKAQTWEAKGKLNAKTQDNKEEIEDCKHISDTLLPREKEEFYPKIEEEIKDIVLTVKNIDKAKENLQREKSDERKKISGRQNTVRDKLIQQMQEYKTHFPAEAMDLSDEIESRHEYLSKLEKILKEGLPAHETTLKNMLNKNTIDDIVAFDNKLDIHEKTIRGKIRSINQHLKTIEFNRGTYIELLAERHNDQEIKKFREELKACYSNILDTNDAYTEDRFNDVQKILNRFRSNSNVDVEWTNKVTDVRNWFTFNASEKYLEDNTEKEFYAGTSGKSGGQKEKLAYTILASALAYQFGLISGEPRSKTFRFVVIDEAFGRGDDESTQFGLGLFKKLNLQLLIVTPLQKIHVIENYINSVHYVSNIEGNNSQLQNLSVEEYKMEKHLYDVATNAIQVTEISQ